MTAALSGQRPINVRANAGQLPVSGPANIPSASGQSPLRWSVSSCRLLNKGQPSCRHAPASPQGKMSLPVASSAPSRVRDELLFNFECPAREPCRPSSPAEQATTANADEIGSLSLKRNYECAQATTCSVGAARVAPSRPVRECALTLRERNQIGSLDKSHIVQHKTGREESHGRPGSGEPRETPLPPFYDAQCVLILRAREHRPRRHAPGCPHFAVKRS